MKKIIRQGKVRVELTREEVDYLSSLVEAQVARLLILPNKKRSRDQFKEEYRTFNKIGSKLSYNQ